MKKLIVNICDICSQRISVGECCLCKNDICMNHANYLSFSSETPYFSIEIHYISPDNTANLLNNTLICYSCRSILHTKIIPFNDVKTQVIDFLKKLYIYGLSQKIK